MVLLFAYCVPATADSNLLSIPKQIGTGKQAQSGSYDFILAITFTWDAVPLDKKKERERKRKEKKERKREGKERKEKRKEREKKKKAGILAGVLSD